MKLCNRKFIALISLMAIIALVLSWLLFRRNIINEYYYLKLAYGGKLQRIDALQYFYRQNVLDMGLIQRYSDWAIEALKGDDETTKLSAIGIIISAKMVMPEHQLENAAKDIIPLLKSSNKRLACQAAHVLGLIRSKEAKQPLVESLGDKELIGAALMALWRLTPKEYIPQIREAYFESKEDYTKCSAAIALGVCGDKTGYELLNEYFNDESRVDLYRIHSGIALMKLGERWPIPILIKIANGDRGHALAKEWVAEALNSTTSMFIEYTYTMSDEELARVIDKWAKWWEENQDKLIWNQEKQLFEIPEQ
jgi:hypothetical protein